ncbi:SEC14 protein 2 [Fasciola hepatica]|uniref:SEC14 protein 2 n=1 Tax=Fasciola hepatica TaxID=6192 RepID=A0A4E0S364_FASHE|nr:SEC14 protein 2 [Fasciola hepatica]
MISELTTEQEELVSSLRSCVSDVNRPECSSKETLVRWLRARNWNVLEAEKMLRSHIKWRLENEVDTILTWFKVPEVIEKYFPGGICGHDKLGRPLFIAPVGCLDPKSFLKCVTRTEFLQSRVYELERVMKVVLPTAAAEAGRPIEQLSVIMDMQGLGLKHMSPSLLTIVSESVTVLESNYPEVLGTCFVVNAPPLFSRLYAFVKPLLSRETQEKIQILDGNYQETLLQYFDASNLPAVYGGTLVDDNGDPRCSAFISWAGVVPECYYSKENQNNWNLINGDNGRSSGDPPFINGSGINGFQLVEVGRGSRRDIPLGWLSAGTQITCNVVCDSHDVDVGLTVFPCPHRDSHSNSESRSGFRTSPSSPNLRREQSNQRRLSPQQSGSPVKRLSPSSLNIPDAGAQTVLRNQRISARDSPFRMQQTAPISGQYYLRLDNSYSWMRVKRVRYSVTVHNASAISLSGRSRSSSILLSSDSPPHSTPALPDHMQPSRSTENTSRPPGETGSNSSSCSDLSIFPIPEDTKHPSLLVTGGSMDVNISLLFRLLARIVLVPKQVPTRH